MIPAFTFVEQKIEIQKFKSSIKNYKLCYFPNYLD